MAIQEKEQKELMVEEDHQLDLAICDGLYQRIVADMSRLPELAFLQALKPDLKTIVDKQFYQQFVKSNFSELE